MLTLVHCTRHSQLNTSKQQGMWKLHYTYTHIRYTIFTYQNKLQVLDINFNSALFLWLGKQFKMGELEVMYHKKYITLQLRECMYLEDVILRLYNNLFGKNTYHSNHQTSCLPNTSWLSTLPSELTSMCSQNTFEDTYPLKFAKCKTVQLNTSILEYLKNIKLNSLDEVTLVYTLT